MEKQVGLCRAQSLLVVIAAVAFIFAVQIEVAGQATFKPGAKVEGSPLSLKDDQYYRECTVIKFDRSANAYQLDCDGYGHVVVQPAYVRAAKDPDAVEAEEPVEKPAPKTKPAPKPEPKPVPEEKPKPEENEPQKEDGHAVEPVTTAPKFQLGDCVAVGGSQGIITKTDDGNFYVHTEGGTIQVPFSSAAKMKKATGCG